MAENGTEAVGAKNGGRKRKAIGLFLLVLAATVIAGYAYWRYRQTHVSTDDAYIDGRIHLVSARVQGTVAEVRVRDNQPVKAGETLLRIDAEPFAVREEAAVSALSAGTADLAAARADWSASGSDVTAAQEDESAARQDVEAAKAHLDQLVTAVEAARAKTKLSAARLGQANRDAERMKALFVKQLVSRELHEKSQTEADVAKAQDDLAGEELRLAQAALPTQAAVIAQRRAFLSQRQAILAQRRSLVTQRQARIGQAEALRKQRESVLSEAALMRRYTSILSPAEGYVTRKGVEAGQVVSPGQSLLAVAALDNVWVVANYKETEIGRIRPGQEVEIRVDTYKGKKFKGTVDSIMAGTGSAFSLFPPENASGNYVKVVQRVPVKIVLSRGEDPGHVLRIGMSVVPTVLVR
ncbi:MAG TPA: HlyD family secretion protein [Candidatus Methylomirabilis sp.]|nr:HlyD family secretion protein [Candidatus Methylomirabilis sp.]